MATGSLTPWRRGSLTSGGGFGSSSGFGGSGSLFDLHRQVNRLFDDLFDRGTSGGMQGWTGGTGWPQLEIDQQEGRLQVTAELPGVNEDDVELTIEDGMLTLAGEKRSERKDDNGYSERSYGRFERRIALPPDVDEDGCQADFKNGVLTVTLPRSQEKARGRRIPLGSGNRPQGSLEAQNDAHSTPRQEAATESDRWSEGRDHQQT
jgi:HSP20 family protein